MREQIYKLYHCEYCDMDFADKGDCERHEETHLREYADATNAEITKELQRLSDVAWGYHIDYSILGMPYPNFQSLIKTVIDRIGGAENGA